MNIRKVINRSSLYSITYVFIGVCLGFVAIGVGLASAEREKYIWVGAAILMCVFIVWIVSELQPEKVFCANQTLIRKYKGKSEAIEIMDLVEIKYHYHAAVGFISNWEFIDRNGGLLNIDGETKGIAKVLSQLEKKLPTFSLIEFKKKFDAGDVEDAIDVWRKA